jgi:hypothetical protein
LNNPLGFVDPTGLYCAWEDGTSDSDPENGGASKQDCIDQGGHWTDQKNICDQAGSGDSCVSSFDWNAPQNNQNQDSGWFLPLGSPVAGAMGSAIPINSPPIDPDKARIRSVVKGVAQETKPLQCAQNSLGNNGIALGLDAAGFVPGESQAAAGVQVGVGVASIANSSAHGDAKGVQLGFTGTTITATNMGLKEMGVGLKAIPFVGYFFNGLAAKHDLSSLSADYKACVSK